MYFTKSTCKKESCFWYLFWFGCKRVENFKQSEENKIKRKVYEIHEMRFVVKNFNDIPW